MKTTDIEKESLEAHVELCAERYDNMKAQMGTIENRLTVVESMLNDIKKMLIDKETQAYRKLISIGITVIGSLVTALLGMVVYMLKTHAF